jgi:hypothetical protein
MTGTKLSAYLCNMFWCLDYFVVLLCTCEADYEVGWLSLRLWFEERCLDEDHSSDVWCTAKLEVHLHDVRFRIVVKNGNIFSEFRSIEGSFKTQ